MTGEPNVKGVAFRSVLAALEALRGSEAVQKALDAMPGDVGNRLRGGTIVASGWYPISWYRAMFQGITRGLGEGRDLVRAIGTQCSDQDLRGVYRYILRVLSPQTVFSVSPRLFNNYYDTGAIEIIEGRKGHARARWHGCAGFDQNMWDEVYGSVRRILELSGATHVRMHILRGGSDGDDELELQAYWT